MNLASAQRLLFFDGAMGTLLQREGLLPGMLAERWVLERPAVIRSIHAAYRAAGADILKTCTFGNNACKLAGSGLEPAAVSRAAVALAREAAGPDGYVALDVGPIGRLLSPLGDLGFEEAVSIFKEAIAGGAGADMILIETMTDAYELKAAVLAAKESCDLPVVATVSPDERGRMLTGADLPSVVALLEGLRVDALGLNCARGPAELFPLITELISLSSLPVVWNPNAGLPQTVGGEAHYDLSPAEFAAWMRKGAEAGVRLLGGCCGTTPAHIRALVSACAALAPRPVEPKAISIVSGYGAAARFGAGTVLIGERINPTGKPKLKEALRRGDQTLILQEAVRQQSCGAQVLDVNAGLPELDEPAVLAALVTKIQGVCPLPLQLDTADPAALGRALRLYNGKPLINSVNGTEASMEAVFPLAQKYGAVIVALTLDEAGIPETVEGRLAIARRILARAARYGIDKKDILVDTLTMTASAGAQNGSTTLAALRRVREELGVNTVLGVSNISFGLPNRELLNATFFTLAQSAGLSAAIVNPYSEAMMNAFRAGAALLGCDPACAAYISAYAPAAPTAPAAPAAAETSLGECVFRGLSAEAAALAKAWPGDPLCAVDAEVIPALDRVGKAYEAGTMFLPGLLMSADAAKAALSELCPAQAGGDLGTVIVATVRGDVHDIGKNIAASLLASYRYRVIDLGRDVEPQRVLSAVREHGVSLVGLSALMTTTVKSMRETVALLKKEAPACKIMVGGAVLTAELAKSMGADRYVPDAMASVTYAKAILAPAGGDPAGGMCRK